MTKQCTACHGTFSCGAGGLDQSCWCDVYPDLFQEEFKQECRCPSCLVPFIVKSIDESIKLNGHEKMVELAFPYRNRDELLEQIDYTIENRDTVFSKWYHLKRGTCCENACRNCPY